MNVELQFGADASIIVRKGAQDELGIQVKPRTSARPACGRLELRLPDQPSTQGFIMFRVVASFAALPAVLAFVAYYAFGVDGHSIAVYFMSVYPAIALLGVPLFLLARKRNWLSGWHFFALGAIAALVPVTPFLADALFTDFGADRMIWLRTYLREASVVAAFGAVHAVLLWVAGVWRNSKVIHAAG
jgi:hypothetical protein